MVLPNFLGGDFVFTSECKKMAKIKMGRKYVEHILILVACYAFRNFFCIITCSVIRYVSLKYSKMETTLKKLSPKWEEKHVKECLK